MNSAEAMIHNLLVETGMEWQAVRHELAEGDRTEAAMLERLCELAEHVPGKIGDQIRQVSAWLQEYDPQENKRHEAFGLAGKVVCMRAEAKKRAASLTELAAAAK